MSVRHKICFDVSLPFSVLEEFILNFIPVQVCFSCVESYVMFRPKRGLWARQHPFSSWTQCQASIWPQAIKTRNFFGEISKPKRHSINYSPSLHQSDNLITTGGGYRVSVRLQSRGSNCNMFAAKKYGSVWCVRRLQGTRMNGNNSSGENAAYFMSHSPEMKKTRKLLVSFFCEWHQWSFCFPN